MTDQEIKMVINDGNDSVEEITRGVNDTEFTKTRETGESFSSLSGLYESGVIEFCKMISMKIPIKFSGLTDEHSERLSVSAGMEALTDIIDDLRNNRTPEPPYEFTSLAQWYKDGLSKFIFTMSSKGYKFKGQDKNKAMIKALIEVSNKLGKP